MKSKIVTAAIWAVLFSLGAFAQTIPTRQTGERAEMPSRPQELTLAEAEACHAQWATTAPSQDIAAVLGLQPEGTELVAFFESYGPVPAGQIILGGQTGTSLEVLGGVKFGVLAPGVKIRLPFPSRQLAGDGRLELLYIPSGEAWTAVLDQSVTFPLSGPQGGREGELRIYGERRLPLIRLGGVAGTAVYLAKDTMQNIVYFEQGSKGGWVAVSDTAEVTRLSGRYSFFYGAAPMAAAPPQALGIGAAYVFTVTPLPTAPVVVYGGRLIPVLAPGADFAVVANLPQGVYLGTRELNPTLTPRGILTIKSGTHCASRPFEPLRSDLSFDQRP